MTSVADRIREVAFPFLADVQIYRDLMESSVAMPTKPDAKLQVIGAGFSRTATLSMYAAFQQLGYKCYHGMEVSIKPGLIDKWLNVLRTDMTQGSTEGINWAEVLRGYEAGFDSPLGDYWLELSRAFPEAKIIYTTRDGVKWVESYHTALIKPMVNNKWYKMGTCGWFPKEHKICKMMQLILAKYDRDFGGLKPELIDKRLEAIRKEIPSERLLVFHPSQGWEPLCKFLDIPVPDTPFPKLNDGPSLAWLFHSIAIMGLGIWAAVIATVMGAVMWLYRHL